MRVLKKIAKIISLKKNHTISLFSGFLLIHYGVFGKRMAHFFAEESWELATRTLH